MYVNIYNYIYLLYMYILRWTHIFLKEMPDTLLTLCPSKWRPNPVHNGAYQA